MLEALVNIASASWIKKWQENAFMGPKTKTVIRQYRMWPFMYSVTTNNGQGRKDREN